MVASFSYPHKAAIKSMAPIEIQRFGLVLGMERERLQNFEQLMAFLLAATKLTLPDSISKRVHLGSPSKDLIHWNWEPGECFTYKGMKQIRAIDGYRCGVLYRIECWLEALGVRYSMSRSAQGSLMYKKGVCEGEIGVFLRD